MIINCSFSLEYLQKSLLVGSRNFKDMPYTYHRMLITITIFWHWLSSSINFKVTMSNSNYFPWTVKISRFTCVKYAMPIFSNNIPVSINLFSPFTPSSWDKPLAVVLIWLHFENRLIQRDWIFTLGLGLLLNNVSFLISPNDLLINVMLNVSIINVSFAAVFLMQSFHTNNFSS